MGFFKKSIHIYLLVFVKFSLAIDKEMQENLTTIQLEKHGGEGTINCTKQCDDDDDDWDWWFWYGDYDSCQVICHFNIKNESTTTTTTHKPKPDTPSIIVIVIPDSSKKPDTGTVGPTDYTPMTSDGGLTLKSSLPAHPNMTFNMSTTTSQ